MIPKGSRILAAITLSVGLACFFGQKALKAQNRNEQAEIGFEVEGSRSLNEFHLTYINYVGECPGIEEVPKRAMFTSSTTPPGSNRRVIVRNLTRGLPSNPFPFTDREYLSGRSSEATNVVFGNSNSKRNFVVVDGDNDLDYEIKEGRTVIERGSFTAHVDHVQQGNEVERNKQEVEETSCTVFEFPCKPAHQKVERVRKCP